MGRRGDLKKGSTPACFLGDASVEGSGHGSEREIKEVFAAAPRRPPKDDLEGFVPLVAEGDVGYEVDGHEASIEEEAKTIGFASANGRGIIFGQVKTEIARVFQFWLWTGWPNAAPVVTEAGPGLVAQSSAG